MKSIIKGFGAIAVAYFSVIVGWIAYSRWGINHNLPLPPAIDARRERFLGQRARFMSYYFDRSAAGRPLVLIHSINAAASAYEMRPIFEHYRKSRPVYALELPGFGFSERSDREYSYTLYKDAIIDFLTAALDEPADVITLSLSGEFAARAALEHPGLFHTLTMISPSGFTARENKVASQQASESQASNTFYNLFANPLWSQAFYDLIATKKSIHYFLQQSFEGKVDAGLEAYSYASSHQPGARYAPLYFVSGKLFTPDIRESVYEKLMLPVLVIYDKDNFVRFDTLPDLVENSPYWNAVRIAPTRGLPQFEKLGETAAALDNFWREIRLAVPDGKTWKMLE
jgi:pimeloyl-ACP methyl ester carboxylesterase